MNPSLSIPNLTFLDEESVITLTLVFFLDSFASLRFCTFLFMLFWTGGSFLFMDEYNGSSVSLSSVCSSLIIISRDRY